MSIASAKFRRWANPETAQEGLTYWCQGCNEAHGIRTKGPGAWSWNGDLEKPVFTPSVLTTWTQRPEGAAPIEHRCHTFVGCNGAQPGEVIFLGDCTHALAGTVQPFPDLPDWLKD